MPNKLRSELQVGDLFTWGGEIETFRVEVSPETDSPYVDATSLSRDTRSAQYVPESVYVLSQATVEQVSKASQSDREHNLQRELERAAERLTEAQRQFEAWKERATEIAHTYANDNSLCSEFDNCMEEIGLRGRNSDYEVVIRVNVTARDEDSAVAQVSESYYYTHNLIDAAYDVEVDAA